MKANCAHSDDMMEKNQMVQGAEGSTSGIDLQCASK
jgi:hypothetical protein